MKLKKINAVLGLLSILLMLIHIGYNVFSYLTMYYNPLFKLLTAIPFMVLVCIHAVTGMLTVFMQKDGSRMDLYPKQNARTILQRVSAALIFPLLILHINTFSLMTASMQKRWMICFFLLMFAEILFFAVIITHISVSFTNAFITLGILTSREVQQKIDKCIFIVNGIIFLISVFAIVRGQIFMFLFSNH